jgi:LPXTG-motif cell wall-anchored protein
VVGVAEASTLAPLVYVELLGAALIGYLACDEIPGVLTVAGAVLIVAAGLLLLKRREQKGVSIPKEPAADAGIG